MYKNKPVVSVLTVLASTVVFGVFYFKQSVNPILFLFFSEQYGKAAAEIGSGQLWRVLTPIFIHLDFFHLLFNAACFLQIGSLLERQFNASGLLLMILGFGIPANIAQYYAGGANFGGLSGILYGMFGFIWCYGVTNPKAQIFMPPYVLALLMIFFVLSWFDVFGNMSNVAHTVGLILGIVSGGALGHRHRTLSQPS